MGKNIWTWKKTQKQNKTPKFKSQLHPRLVLSPDPAWTLILSILHLLTVKAHSGSCSIFFPSCGDNGQRVWHCFGSCEGLGISRQMILYLQLFQISYSRKIELFYLAPFHITMFSALRFALVVLQPLPFPFSPSKHRAHFLQNGANSLHKGSCSHQPHLTPRAPFNLSLQCSLHMFPALGLFLCACSYVLRNLSIGHDFMSTSVPFIARPHCFTWTSPWLSALWGR